MGSHIVSVMMSQERRVTIVMKPEINFTEREREGEIKIAESHILTEKVFC